VVVHRDILAGKGAEAFPAAAAQPAKRQKTEKGRKQQQQDAFDPMQVRSRLGA
jgi:hypothetical protein